MYIFKVKWNTNIFSPEFIQNEIWIPGYLQVNVQESRTNPEEIFKALSKGIEVYEKSKENEKRI
jgi:hypothetical protein